LRLSPCIFHGNVKTKNCRHRTAFPRYSAGSARDLSDCKTNLSEKFDQV
jgi:hypothetical protein